MAIFKLQHKNNNIENSFLLPATRKSIEAEKYLEGWLENSPWAIAQEPLLIIGRQTSASTGEYGTIFPDLLGLDEEGNLVVIELKKGRTPREVIAQLLEYAAWANDLTEDNVLDLASDYIKRSNSNKELGDLFCDTFETEALPTLNRRLRLFIAAEEVTPSVSKVCRFLRQVHGVDISCIQFNIYQTDTKEVFISSESIVGLEDIGTPKSNGSAERWSGDKTCKQVVRESIQEFTGGDRARLFSTAEINQIILRKYPHFNHTTTRPCIIADTVNHTSRQFYSGGEDLYWTPARGRFKLYNPSTDS